jgi:hypothetical protein
MPAHPAFDAGGTYRKTCGQLIDRAFTLGVGIDNALA